MNKIISNSIMNDSFYLLVGCDGSFQIILIDYYGVEKQISWALDISECLKIASRNLGYTLILPIQYTVK